MKVQKVIDMLSKLPPDTEVHFDGFDDYEAEEKLTEMISNALPSDDLLPEDMDVKIRDDWKLLPLKETENTNCKGQ